MATFKAGATGTAMSVQTDPKTLARRRKRQVMASIPRASEVKVTRADGTVTLEPASKESAAAVIRRGQRRA